MRPTDEGHKYYGLLSEVPPGWHQLVTELLDALGDVPGWKNEYVLQIKTKFGGLRFYHSARLEPTQRIRVDSLIRKAEERAYRTCERCGTTDDVKQRASASGWQRTECGDCEKARP